MTGKIATVLQMLSIVWILLQWDVQFPPVWFSVWTYGAAICTGISGLLYVWDGMKQLSFHPDSSANSNR